jgi:hypothetical protein
MNQISPPVRVAFLLLLILIVLAGCNVNAQGGRGSKKRNKELTEQQAVKPIVTATAKSEQPEIGESVPERTPRSNAIVWQADFETRDLSQWNMGESRGDPKADSGLCFRPNNGVTDEQAHSGSYSMKMVINTLFPAGCRQFRKPEPQSGESYYYSAWFYIPERVQVGVFWNLFQFKANLNGKSGLFWKLDVRNNETGDMVIVPVWDGPIAGPQAGDGVKRVPYFQTKTTMPVGEWFHLEVYLKQSEEFDGHIIVWQDGIELLNMDNVRTKWTGGYQSWSVNNYGRQLKPNPTTLYIDDVIVSMERVGP